jgi:uncharacterized protein
MKKLLFLLFMLMGVTVFSYEKTIDKKTGLIFERDVKITMRDGKVLYGNVFRPIKGGKYPVITSMGPYGKDDLPVKYDSDEGNISVSKYAGFEVVDPAYWVPEGYVVVNVDSRGSWKSEGNTSVFSQKEAEDYYDIIEWAGKKSWSNGNVATTGVSYFAISQWRVAELNPPHLKAIVPWEGLTDIYRDAIFHGGMEEEGFFKGWYKYKILKAARPGSKPEDFIGELEKNLTYNDFYKERTPNLSKITIPAFIVASWGDHGLHTRGTVEGYKNISSKDKWLYIHGLKKWEFFYSDRGVAEQKRFLDYYLKGIDTGMKDVPSVRYAVRDKYYVESYKFSENYPINNTKRVKVYLNNTVNVLSEEKSKSESMQIITKEKNSKIRFNYTFDKDVNIVGGMTLMTYVSTSKGDDADLFVGIEKFDRNRGIVYLQGNDTSKGHVASGWLRVSQRKVDWEKTDEDRIFLAHDEIQKINPDEIVKVYIEIQPSGTSFKKGETLSVIISDKDLKGAGKPKHVNINKGEISVYTGGKYQSYLEVPVLK